MQYNRFRIISVGLIYALMISVATGLWAQSTEDLVELSLEELMNMEVTVASKNAEKISDAAGVISVINMDDLERFGGITLRDILERVPSLIGIATGFNEMYGLASRGDQIKDNSGHILILINGRPTREITDGGISSETLAAFPVNIIEHIEVIRGPGSVLYGSQAFSAVINIKTKEAEANNVAVSALTGVDGAIGANAYGTVQAEDFNMMIGGRYMDKGGQEFTYNNSKSKLVDQAKSGYVEMNYKGLSLMAAHNAYEASYFGGNPDVNNWSKTFSNLGYGLKAGESWDMDFNVTYNHALMQSGDAPGIDRKSNDLVTEWTNHISLGNSSRLIIGGLYNLNKGSEYLRSEDSYITEDHQRGSFAMYSQADYWMLDNLKLIGGFQVNKVKGHDLNIVPRLGTIWYPVKKLNVKALYSQAYRAPGINELYLNFTGRKGDPDLKPEKITTLDLGINYNGQKFQVGANYFISNQKDIVQVLTDQTPQYYANSSKVVFKGVEFEGKYYPVRELLLTGSLLYQQNENEEGEEHVTPVAMFGSKFGISYKWKKGITLSFFDIYQGNYGDLYVGSDNHPKPGAYNLLNLYSSFDLVKLFGMGINQNISLFVQANNLLNKDVWVPNSYTDSMPSVIGRSVLFGFKFSLK